MSECNVEQSVGADRRESGTTKKRPDSYSGTSPHGSAFGLPNSKKPDPKISLASESARKPRLRTRKGSSAALIASTICIILIVFLSASLVFIVKGQSREATLQKQNEELAKALERERAMLTEYVSLGISGALFQTQAEIAEWTEENKTREDTRRQILTAIENGEITADHPDAELPAIMDPLPSRTLLEQIQDAKQRSLRFAARNGHLTALHHLLTETATPQHSPLQTTSKSAEECPIPYDDAIRLNHSLLHAAATTGQKDALVYLIHVASLLQRNVNNVVPRTESNKELRNAVLSQIIGGGYQTPSSVRWNDDPIHIASLHPLVPEETKKDSKGLKAGIAGLLGLKRKPPTFSVDIGDHKCRTPLQIAAMEGHVDTVELLLKGKEHLGNFDSIRMFDATTVKNKNSNDMIEGTSVSDHVKNHPAVRGKRTASSAPEATSIDPAEMHTVDVYWKVPDVDHVDYVGSTALHLAVDKQHFEVVKVLVEKGGASADLPMNKPPSEDSDDAIYKLALSTRKDKCLKKIGPLATPLHFAAQLKDDTSKDGEESTPVKIIRYLISSSAKARILASEPTFGITPLVTAFQNKRYNSFNAMLEALPKEIADYPNLSPTPELINHPQQNIFTDIQRVFLTIDGHGVSLFGRIISLGDPEMLRKIISYLAPLDTSVPRDSSKNRQILRVRSDFFNVVDNNGWTPIHILGFLDPQNVRGLLEFIFTSGEFDTDYININALVRDSDKRQPDYEETFGQAKTVLEFAKIVGFPEVMQSLIRFGAVDSSRVKGNLEDKSVADDEDPKPAENPSPSLSVESEL